MIETLVMSVLLTFAFALWVGGVTVYCPGALTALIERAGRHRQDPRPLGLPIEQLAADLRRLLREHERLLRSKDWQRVHHLRVVELALHDRAEEAATALGLPPCRLSEERWSTADLERRLWQLRAAGLVLPETAGLGPVG